MYYFSPETIAQANKNIEAFDSKIGGLLCVLHCLSDGVEENVSYTINGEKLRRKLSLVFDKDPKEAFENAKSSYIIFAKNWASTFFDIVIKNKMDILSFAVFFLRRYEFERKLDKDEVVELFIREFNLDKLKNFWFVNENNIELEYNQYPVEENQTEFYRLMEYDISFKSILFQGVIQKSAADIKAAGQIQTLYSGSGVQKCFLLSDEPLDKYYILLNSQAKKRSELDDEHTEKDFKKYAYKTGYNSKFGRNRIIFGAPGTGKSFLINKERKNLIGDNNEEDYERVTFHPDYTYANFVGTYKPVMRTQGATAADGADDVLKILRDNTMTAQEKYDMLYEQFSGDNLTRLPILIGLYSDGEFATKKVDGSPAANNNSVERNHGKAIRPYVNLDFCESAHEEITYEYVPGPFMRTLVKALRSSMAGEAKPHLLIIEEINRANVAAVFGDVFQLLDRDADGVSEYPIETTQDMRRYLSRELDLPEDEFNKIRIPDNMFIWATMNSADQGVFPMDTAFKRRWDFEYLSINTNEAELGDDTVVLGTSSDARTVKWNELRKAINTELVNYKVNEDKLMGTFFIPKAKVPGGEEYSRDSFIRIFKNKVIMYLYEDAARQKSQTLFSGSGKKLYSEICEAFDTKGVNIFCDSISSRFPADNGEQ